MSLTELAAEVQKHIDIASTIKHLRVSVVANCNSLHLNGTAYSFYQKQMVQQIAMQYLQHRAQLVNNITVIERKEGSNLPPINPDT